jgi:anthranilate synthase component 1
MTAMPKPSAAPSPPPPAIRALVRELDFAPAPLALFRRLADDGRRAGTCLLESAEPGSRRSQRSLLVLSAALSVVCRGEEVAIDARNANGAHLLPLLAEKLAAFAPRRRAGGLRVRIARPSAHGAEAERLQSPSVLSVLRTIVADVAAGADVPADAVFLAGVFSYDLAGQFEDLDADRRATGAPAEDDVDRHFPDYRFVLADRLAVVDHLARRTRLVAAVFGDADDARGGAAARADLDFLADVAAALPPAHDAASPPVTTAATEAHSDRSDAEFRADVAALQRRIVAGDVFQIVPSRTFSRPCRDPMGAYAMLRALNPSPYLFYFQTGEFTLFGASPESALKVDGVTRAVEISPIAGTRPRGLRADGSIDPDLDGRIEAELRLDAKENAEHMMLVDLARNDVARIAEPGSRHVAELLRVVRYSHVMHLASRVVGRLRDGLDALHAWQACLTMGTLTGAPKVRAMQLLRAHEPGRRGHYGGAIGYLRGDGSLDTAIVIRAALVRDGVARVRAGAGVVHDSVPALEADETRRKAEAVLRAIALADAGADVPKESA